MRDKPHITLVVGARPNFMKVASLISSISARDEPPFRFTLVHTGQHYDPELSQVFFEELGLPEPDVNFGVGSGSHARQTAEIMSAFEDFLTTTPTDCVVVVGDVNSTLACTLVAAKSCIPVAHVEAGLESGDRAMPEEINRLATDAIATYLFCTSDIAVDNLRRRGQEEDKIFLVGNTMIDTLIQNLPRTKKPHFWEEKDLSPGSFIVCTLHRPSNVDSPEVLNGILNHIADKTRGPVILPVHPRTSPKLDQQTRDRKNLILVDPLGYLEFLHLVKQARYVITDSGGIQEETTYLGTPCLTLRNNTERPETVLFGTNELVRNTPEAITSALQRVENGHWKKGTIPPLWDGQAGTRIIDILSGLLADNFKN